MNSSKSTTKQARRSRASVRRLGAGSVLAVALVAAGASPALAGTGHSAGHAGSAATARGTRIAAPSHVAVRLGPAVSMTRTAAGITVVH